MQKLDGYVGHLRRLESVPLDEYLEDENIQAIVERRLQLCIQVCMDIASYLTAQLGLRSPEEPENVFVVLGQSGILSPELARRMAGMVRFRNILVHDYLDIDSGLVHEGLQGELEDFDQFSLEIASRFLTESQTNDVAG